MPSAASSRTSTGCFWHGPTAATLFMLYLVYLGYCFMTGTPLPQFLVNICGNMFVRIVVIVLLLCSIIHGDLISALLIFLGYGLTCHLAGQHITIMGYEFMDNPAQPAPAPPATATGVWAPPNPTTFACPKNLITATNVAANPSLQGYCLVSTKDAQQMCANGGCAGTIAVDVNNQPTQTYMQNNNLPMKDAVFVVAQGNQPAPVATGPMGSYTAGGVQGSASTLTSSLSSVL